MPYIEPAYQDAVTLLIEHEWYVTPDGWRHPRMHWPWPMIDAYRVQQEALAGGRKQIHRALRKRKEVQRAG